MDDNSRRAAHAAWQRTCQHIEGLAVASTIAGFGALGLYDRLLAGPCPVDAALSGTPSGYAAVGLRLLEHLAWIDYPVAGELRLTEVGRRTCAQWTACQRLIANGPTSPSDHPYSDAFLLTPLLLRLHDSLPSGARRDGGGIGDAVSEAETALLDARGLLAPGGRLTAEGAFAVAFAPQCRHVSSYAPLLARVPALLDGTDVFVPAGLEEVHLDRAADIHFSGEVYAAACAPGVARMARRIASERPFRTLIDVGAGDGTMLLALYRELAPMLSGLTAVAVEPSPVAREIMSRRFQAAGIAYRVLAGDVGDPRGIRDTLASQGIALRDSLVTMKSVLHDRELRVPCPTAGPAVPMSGPHSANRFVGPDGELASAAWVEADLIACLSAWRRVLGPAGMLLVEAHTAPATIPHPERALLVALDATHGYSHQYLLEAEVHLNCCVAAGFRVDWTPVNEQLGFVALSGAWLIDSGGSMPELRRS